MTGQWLAKVPRHAPRPARGTVSFGGLFRERSFYQSPLARKAYRGLRRGFAAAGLDVVLKTFYSPIPDLARLPPDTFARRSELVGTGWDLDRQLDFVRDLAPLLAEFRHGNQATRAPLGAPVYAPNPSYGPADAALLHAVVRSARPQRIIELGSGHSTLVIAGAARRNADDGHAVTYEAFDPFPGVARHGVPGLTRLERIAAQDVPLATFGELGAGDILFVDTTHTVKVGSDVNFIILEVLPRLRPGVLVHLHDIFLPYEYPRQWLEEFGLYWTEQYLVHALLVFSSGFEVLAAMHALQRDRAAAMPSILGPRAVEHVGGAFWMRRVADDG